MIESITNTFLLAVDDPCKSISFHIQYLGRGLALHGEPSEHTSGGQRQRIASIKYSQNVAFGDYARPAGGPSPTAALSVHCKTASISLSTFNKCQGHDVTLQGCLKCVMQNGLN